MQVILSTALQQRIFAQMENAFPNEGGGFLLGTPSAEAVTIVDVIQVENVFDSEEQYHRYAMTPRNWAQMEDEADARSLKLVGYYHSHPNSPAIPSEYDRVHALPNFIYVITAVVQGHAEDMRVWTLHEDRSQFYPGSLQILD